MTSPPKQAKRGELGFRISGVSGFHMLHRDSVKSMKLMHLMRVDRYPERANYEFHVQLMCGIQHHLAGYQQDCRR